MVKAVSTAKKFPKSRDLGVFLSIKTFLPRPIVLKFNTKPSLKGGFCIVSLIIIRKISL